MPDSNVYYSHYDQNTKEGKKLELHLQEVAEAASRSVPPVLHFDGINNKQVQKLLEWQACFHDFGKYTDYFQNYLLRGRHSTYQDHAHISALAFYHCMKRGWIDADCDEKTKETLSFLSYIIIRKHHGKLATDGLFPLEDVPRMQRKIRAQAENLLQKKQILSNRFHLAEDQIRQLLLCLEKTLQDKKFVLSMKRMRMNHAHARWYFLLIYCFSQLVDKDKSSAAGLPSRDQSPLQPDWVLEYLHLKKEDQLSDMNQKREQARRTVLRQIDELDDQALRANRIFTFTAPTGLGKTLTSMQAAFRLRERLEKIYSYPPKIITAIPFINIIEQTKADYAKVLKNRGILNIHHRLADRRLVGDSDEAIPVEKAMLEVESWEGDVVLTTFVQFFQSLVTGQNARLMKVNKLAGSIVILDEIQSIPEKYMPFVGAMIIKLSEYLGTRFILMSATQPYLLEMGKQLLGQTASETGNAFQSVSLLPDYADYYKLQTRTKLVPSFHQDMDTHAFRDFFEQTWSGRSAVIVVNTIQRCVDLYAVMKDRFEDAALVYHLSTNLIPKERKRVIREVQEALENGNKVILVSTQTIEAGVDLDFEVGYRDLAPLESIIQTAGRVNRNGNIDRACPVYIVQIKKDHQWIYPLHHLERTKKLLQQQKEIEEPDYLPLVDAYYRQMADFVSRESVDLWKEGIMALDFEKVSRFQLIPDDQSVVDVFVEFNEEAEMLADAYEMILLKEDMDVKFIEEATGEKISVDPDAPVSPFQRKALLRLVLSRMSEYMVQIRMRRWQETKPLSFSMRGGVETSFYWVPRSQLNDFYQTETGYGATGEARMW